jgi:hypothetical protein
MVKSVPTSANWIIHSEQQGSGNWVPDLRSVPKGNQRILLLATLSVSEDEPDSRLSV